ncbi:unnamed protein product [Paramecium octaurelia]|uniref:Uncharacterized protein n=1 Tax=Paramecium octaurelia TaxID=43137 RepID=A0A8S1TF25_PAROT|nr:unnamed protein product [Paramecium octaurelia]
MYNSGSSMGEIEIPTPSGKSNSQLPSEKIQIQKMKKRILLKNQFLNLLLNQKNTGRLFKLQTSLECLDYQFIAYQYSLITQPFI